MKQKTTAKKGRRPNLLVLGASGNVARAFLLRLAGQRRRFGRIVLLDKSDRVLHEPFLDMHTLDALFIRRALRLPEEARSYSALLRKHSIDLVADLSDIDTVRILPATDAAGASYLNTSLADAGVTVVPLVDAVLGPPQRYTKAPHLLCSGMNPGVVNIWACHGVARHGVPKHIVHYEEDTSAPADGWRPSLTWSPSSFLAESVREPSGWADGALVRELHPNAVEHRESLKDILEPLGRRDSYPRAFTVLHEENVLLGRRFGSSSRFLYAIHPRTMDHIAKLWRSGRKIRESDLPVVDNIRVPLSGSDTIGVMLDYSGKRVYYQNSVDNASVHGTSATCLQVAVGVWAGLLALLGGHVKKGVHFPGDLLHTAYSALVFDNLRVSEKIFQRRGQRWVMTHHDPAVRARGAGRTIL